MIHTSPSDRIEDFIEFFKQVAGQQAVSARRGASLEEIDRLRILCRFLLPTLYVGYLQEFGRADGLLCLGDDGYPQIEDLLRFYEKQSQMNYSWVPKDSVVISLPAVAEGRALIYSDEYSGREPQVGTFYDTDVNYICASSFRNFLYNTAFVRSRFPLNKNACVYLRARGTRTAASLIEFSVRLGFIPYWFCDEYLGSLELGSAFLWIAQYRDRAYLALNSIDITGLDHIRSEFMKRFAMEDV